MQKEWISVKRRALVLGGGGTVGIAWEVGLFVGLLENGIDLGQADLIVGTSAGSVVGSLIAAGYDLRQVLAIQQATTAAESSEPILLDPDGYQRIAAKWWTAHTMDVEACKEIGQMALQTKTISEADWIGRISQLVGDHGLWPEKALRITGVDTATGEWTTWDRSSGVPLHLAITASCTVPGIFPPVQIGGRRYMDGGVRSGTNADLAIGYDSVVIIAPLGSEAHQLGNRQMLGEAKELEAAGAGVATIVPDQETLAGFGISMMDQSRVAPAAANGVRQGHALAEQIASIWR